MIHDTLISVLRGFDTVAALVGRNRKYNEALDQLVIRPGTLDADDPYPGLVVLVPAVEVDWDLSFRAGFATATVEVRALSFGLANAVAITKAVAWNGEDPADVTRTQSGLDGYRSSANGVQSSKLVSIDESVIEPDDKSDRQLWLLESVYLVEFSVDLL